MSFCIDKTVDTLFNMVWTLLYTFCNDIGGGAQQVCARYDLRGSLSAKLNRMPTEVEDLLVPVEESLPVRVRGMDTDRF